MSNPKFVRNEVTYITNEIDYDKLAEAIVKAQHQEVVLTNDENTDDNKNKKTYTSKMLGIICSFIFRIIAGFGAAIFIMLIIAIFMYFNLSQYATENGIFNTVFFIIFYVFLCAITGVLSFFLFKSADEIEIETDKHYIVSMFSSLVCVAALIVSLVALFK